MPITVGDSKFKPNTLASAIYKTKGAGELRDKDGYTVTNEDNAVEEGDYTWHPVDQHG